MRKRVVLATTDSRVHRRVGEWLSGRGFFIQGWENAGSEPEALPELLREGEPASAVLLGFPLGEGRGLELIRALEREFDRHMRVLKRWPIK